MIRSASFALVMLVITAVWIVELSPPVASPPASTGPAASSPQMRAGSTQPSKGELAAGLGLVRVIEKPPRRPGYERGCGSGEGCVFGPAWTDDHEGRGGHDGCDTRNNVLQRDLTAREYRSGTNDCVVIAGILNDPYTGEEISFTKAAATAVPVDHLYPLSAAWSRGAHAWPLAKRIQFANDIDRNLLAVDGSANASKGDRTPGEWMPINRDFRCDYLTRFIQVAVAYDLPITVEDHSAVTAAQC